MVFVSLALYRSRNVAEFTTGQSALDANMGIALTAVLVTSGAFAAVGVHAFRRQDLMRARRGFLAAAAIGIVFVIIKAIDYTQHASNGHGLGDGDFWDAYVLATGFHFAHVLLGAVMLIIVGRKIGKAAFPDSESAIAGVALFWHMCDIAWFFLFPLFYAPVTA
tara:strand:- start:208 stop:699 length:492 start_codon:yes stop_codon:yes gene_type:complete